MNPDDHSTFSWFSEAELPQTFVTSKDIDDDEVKAIYRGFSLLNGKPLNY